MKILKIAGKVLAWTLAVMIVVLAALHVGVTVVYTDFFGNADAAFRIPGLTTGFVPQGFHYLEEQDTWLISGYMLIRHAVFDVLAATPILQSISESVWNWPLVTLSHTVFFVLLFALRSGIRQAFASTGGESPKDWIGRAILARISSFAIALWSTLVPLTEPGAFFGPQIMDEWKWLYYGRSIAFIALEIYVLVCISKQTKALAGRAIMSPPPP